VMAHEPLSTCERDLRPVRAVALWSLTAWVLAMAISARLDKQVGVGVALGGAIGIACMALHLQLVRRWLLPSRNRTAGRRLWLVWAAKWPLIIALLWLGITMGWADPMGVCVGVAVVPAMATLFALRTMLTSTMQKGLTLGSR